MADISDVLDALVALCGQAIYPNGTSQPGVIAEDVRIYPGWVIPDQLDKDLAKGIATVNVYPMPEEARTTRYLNRRDPICTEIPAPQLEAAVTNPGEVTYVGTLTNPHNAALLVDGVPYVYPAQAGDTAAIVAASLATLISVDRPASSAGPVLSIPGDPTLSPRIGVFGTTVTELKRQRRSIQIIIWCKTPVQRTAIGRAIDEKLAGIDFISLPDLTGGWLLYRGSPYDDQFSRANTYRRDLRYTVDYGTTKVETHPTITVPYMVVKNQADELIFERYI